MTNSKKIKGTLKKQFPVLREKYHVKTMGIFGSFARGEENAKSDVDIVVEFTSPMGFFDFIRLEKTLSESLGRQVDLVTKSALKPAIKADVLKEVIYV
jgi:hypothetical protein